jgi:hypothetical protein
VGGDVEVLVGDDRDLVAGLELVGQPAVDLKGPLEIPDDGSPRAADVRLGGDDVVPLEQIE